VADDSAKSTGNPGPFDVRTVKNLVALMAQHDLSEIDLRDGTQRLRLRRGGSVAESVPMPMPVPPAAARPVLAGETSTPAAAPAAKPGKKLAEIKSETVGTFYTRPSPDAPPFVTVGSKVTPNTVVCTVEAMKTYSPVEAGISGTIVEICAQDGLPVEFNQVLFRVEV
jgi:acetyl-CoA carboxylase biotin carboxyl carrier protein